MATVAKARVVVGWLVVMVLGLACIPASAEAAPPPRPVTLVGVQMQVDLADYSSPAAFAAKIEGLMKQAMRTRGDGPRLVVFPEDVGLGLTVMDDYQYVQGASTWTDAASTLIYIHWPGIYNTMVTYGCSPMRALLILKGDTVRQVYVDTFSRAAKEHHVTIVAGSAPLPDEEGNVFSTSYVFGPTGELIGAQRKVHLIDLEGPYGLDLTPAPLDEIHAIDTPAGRLGIGICLDMFPQVEGEPADVVEALVADGAQILVQPSFNPQPWDEWQQGDWKRGLLAAMQTHPTVVAGVNPMMVGSLFDIAVEGVSSLISNPGAEYLAEASSATEEDIVSAQVLLPRRAGSRQ